jgi:CheY-like chemotaxis protein
VVNSVSEVQQALEGARYDVLVFNQNLEAAEVLDRMADNMPTVKLLGSVNRTEIQMRRDSQERLIILSKPVTPPLLLDGVNEAITRFYGVAQAAPEELASELSRLDGAHLLLVEDTPSNQTIITGILEQVGAVVDVDNNGAEAVARLAKQGGTRYDVVLMDVQMPVMDGFTATRKIREELGLSIPIIAMTAGVLAFERRQCIESGMNEFIGKPLDIPKMLETIAKYIPNLNTVDSPSVTKATVPAQTSTTQTAAVVGVFDPERILGFVRGRPERERQVVEMIEQIVTADTAPIEEGQRLLAQGDMEAARRHYHTLKGSIGNFGAEGVRAAAQELELAIRDRREQAFAALLESFAIQFQQMLQVAQRWLQQYHEQHPQVPDEPQLAGEEFAAALQVLRTKLNASSLEAVDLFRELQPTFKIECLQSRSR